MTLYYAHTGKSKYNIPPQLYADHIRNMYNQIIVEFKILSPFLQKVVLIAAIFHDFGKLIDSSQKILNNPDQIDDVKMVNHVDAGVAWCLMKYQKTNDSVFVYAAYLIHAHHIGLQNRQKLFDFSFQGFTTKYNITENFRDSKHNDSINNTVKEYYDSNMDSLYDIQYALLSKEIEHALSLEYSKNDVTPIELRFALSVLIDADHGDVTKYYDNGFTFHEYKLRASERLKLLDSEVKQLQKNARQKGISEEVIASRNALYEACSTVKLTNKFYMCAAPTGKGKTVSLMKLALRISEETNKKRIFFIIPFTNIISQSVKEYRNKIVLPSEKPEKIVNEIHSKVEFDHFSKRKYSHLWNAPINISTSVQFFESLTSNRPSAVRKLQKFANSVIIFDEYHTALPHHLWKVALQILKIACEKFNIHIVFGSGTHVHYWDGDDSFQVTDVVPDELYNEFKKFEKNRIEFKKLGMIKNMDTFYKKFNAAAVKKNKLIGNTIIVTNTVANTVYMTEYFKKKTNWKIFHMSSCLTPADRERILADIHVMLKNDEKILLIATSVAECGIDFSFEIGFREFGSLMSTIQFGGRVNRNNEKTKSYVYEFEFDKKFFKESEFTNHPGLSDSIKARRGLKVSADNCTNAIQNEIALKDKPDLVDVENSFRFKQMKDDFSVIDTCTVSVIIDRDIVNKIKSGERVDPVQINRHSISIFRSKIDENTGKWAQYVEKFDNDGDDMYYWIGKYDGDGYGVYACEISN